MGAMRRTLLTSLLVALLALPAGAQAAKAPSAAVKAAERRATSVFDAPRRLRSDFSLRSRRSRSWALVTGFAARPWAAWVHRRKGHWRVRYVRTRGSYMPSRRVPCDIRPAFSEPSC